MPGANKPCPQCWLLVGPFETKCPRCGAVLGNLPPTIQPTDEDPSKFELKPIRCKKCDAESPPGVKYCPACGDDLTNPDYTVAGSTGVWPPHAGILNVPEPPASRLLTKTAWLDIVIGMFVAVVSTLSCVLLPFMIYWYYKMRDNYLHFCRGIAYGLALVAFMILAPCLMCLAGPSLPWLHKVFPWVSPFGGE